MEALTRPVTLKNWFNASTSDEELWPSDLLPTLATLPSGRQDYWGMPFEFADKRLGAADLVLVGGPSAVTSMELPIDDKATYVVFAHFCDEGPADIGLRSGPYAATFNPGSVSGRYSLVYEDGSETVAVLRRRFEIAPPSTSQSLFLARRSSPEPAPVDFRGPHPRHTWGRAQTGVVVGELQPPRALEQMREVPGHWVLYALENPTPDVQIRVIRIKSEEDSMVGVGGVTLFRGVSHPFRRERLHTLYIEEDSTGSDAPAPEINVDLGVVARTYPATPVDIATWLSDSDLDSDSLDLSNGPRAVCAEVTASLDATLNVDGSGIAMRTLYDTSNGASEDGRWHVRIVDRDRTWLHGRIVDAETGKPTPARIHFRSVEGRYLPPYGHRAEVNTDWFQDYGADLKVGSTQYAYVNGDFRIEVPIGPVLVEVRKGFEYIPVRAQIEIDPGQTELKIPLKRLADRRSEGWVTADTHVHFLSPDTALLEAKAEDVNIVNLLAAQWGDLYTNVGDIRGELAGSSDADTLVWVGTENRQHFLGHISLLGVHGEPVIPFSTSGPGEGYIGDGTANPLAEWADEARGKEGLVIAPHFPMPHSEIIADVILGKIDAVEIAYWWSQTLDDFRVQDWYRLLGCGYRVPVVGGTDKMSAGVPLGGTRTYAHIGDRALDFDAWAQAVRAGRTYMTSGPLLEFEVDGRMAGSEIKLPVKGGSVHVKAVGVSSVPLRSLEVVVNGRVVTGTTANGDDQTMLTLEEDVVIEASSWIAARCNTGRMAPAEPAELATLIAAHSSPVYVSCGGSLPRVEPETGRYFLTTMQGGIEWLDTLATIESHAAQERIRHVFIDAMDELRDRMHDGS